MSRDEPRRRDRLGFPEGRDPLRRVAVGHRREDAVHEDLAHEQDLLPRQVHFEIATGARTPEKERFRTHEAQVIAQWEGCAIDRLAAYLAQVKAAV